ncbi:MAG: ribosome-associated translation inhibitor RaiA [Mariprofundales bacterium]
MRVSITGRHLDLTAPIKQYMEEKLQHLKHSFDQVIDVHVVLAVQKRQQCAEVSIQANGIHIHASKKSDDMYASIDGVVDKLNRQLKRYRAKLHRLHISHNKRKGREIKASMRVLDHDQSHEEIPVDAEPNILHHESTAVKPMSVDEALMQLELSNDAVLVFTNQETDTINVISRRIDGKYNWIEPASA